MRAPVISPASDYPQMRAPLPATSSFVYPGFFHVDQDEDEFRDLAKQWRLDIRYLSSIDQITSHDKYLEIIARGEKSLPHILRDFQKRGGEWYRALRAIAVAHNIPLPTITLDDRRNSKRVEQKWIAWGKEHGYLVR